MRKVLLALLIVVAVVMMYLGVNSGIKPPIYTGVGFIIIAILFLLKDKRD